MALLPRWCSRRFSSNSRTLIAILALFGVLYTLNSLRTERVSTDTIRNRNCLPLQTEQRDKNSDAKDSECRNQPEGAINGCDRRNHPELKSTFKTGAWRSWYVSPAYHRHYKVNCSGIIHDNQTIIREAYELVREEQQNSSLLLPCDETVMKWSQNCDKYKKDRRYPLKPLSQEEADYPIAYIMLVHKHAAQVERLLRAIYQPQNVYCISMDANSAPDFQNAIIGIANCFHNVFISSKLERIQYMGFSRVQADINCMSDLMKHQWKYVINLCGQDFPLKTNLEIVKQLKAYKGFNDIPGIFPEQTKWFVGRTKFRHKVVKGEVVRTDIEKPSPPHNALMYFGNAYYAASRLYVHYVLNNEIAKDLLEYLSDSLSPDEHYWVTVNRYPGVPGGYPNSTWKSNVRFIRWTNSDYYAPCVGKYIRAVCVIGAGYLPYLSTQPHMFVNKIHYDYDPIALQCLEELLDYRTVFPETIGTYVPKYPVTNLFP